MSTPNKIKYKGATYVIATDEEPLQDDNVDELITQLDEIAGAVGSAQYELEQALKLYKGYSDSPNEGKLLWKAQYAALAAEALAKIAAALVKAADTPGAGLGSVRGEGDVDRLFDTFGSDFLVSGREYLL